VHDSHLRLLQFEGRRPRGAGLWRCGMLTLRQHDLDPGLGAERGGRGPASIHSLLVRGQRHRDSFHHDRHRLARHALITSRCGEPGESYKRVNWFLVRLLNVVSRADSPMEGLEFGL